MNRRHLLLAGTAGALGFSFVLPASAANTAEDFVSGNIQQGFDILNDRGTSAAQRKERFAAFVVGLTDVKRVAVFLLGRYANASAPADMDAVARVRWARRIAALAASSFVRDQPAAPHARGARISPRRAD